MKTILAATDFSRTAGNALRYAAALANDTGSRLVLVHIQQPPIASAEGYVFIPDFEAMKKEGQKKLERISRDILNKTAPGLKIICQSRLGTTVDEISLCAEQYKAWLVVMGMRESESLTGKLLGSVTTAFIRRSKLPVLSIHNKQKYRKISSIVLASDYRELPDPAALKPLKTLAKHFGANIRVLHVFKGADDIPTFTQAYEGLRLKQRLSGIRHTFHGITNKNTVEGINRFVKEQKTDLLVLFSHRHNLLRRIFLPSNNKEMAFAAIVPLLTLKAS
jgi:nucleotide-binding universal stress UspA family protein